MRAIGTHTQGSVRKREPGIRDSSPLCVILALVVLSIEETVRLLRLTTDYMRAWAST